MKKGKLLTRQALTMLATAAAIITVTSCQEEDFGYTAEGIKYTEAFKKAFGDVDPEQTWIDASYGYILAGENSSIIKIFDSSTSNLIGNYSNVSAGDSLFYNITVGAKPLVSNGRSVQLAESGQTVYFNNGTRAKADMEIYINSHSGKYISLTPTQMTAFKKILPEDEDNITSSDHTDFEFKSGSSYTIYPLYWGTIADLTVGLYYYDSEGQIQLWGTPIYKNRAGNEQLQGSDDGTTWENIGAVSETDPSVLNYKYYRSEGITVTIPDGTIFGIYVQQTYRNRIYRYFSSAAINEAQGCDIAFHNNNDAVHAAAFNVTDNIVPSANSSNTFYLGFEDWDNNVFDLNDIMLVITPVTVIDYTDQTYMMAFEDLGATSYSDIDFNDCVLKLQAANGDTEGKVTLMAAGGTLPIQVSYDGTVLFDEIHKAFNSSAPTNVPINADVNNLTENTVSTTIKLNATAFEIGKLAKKIQLKVTQASGDVSEIGIPLQSGSTPQAFLITGDSWTWPNEQVNIKDVYPNFTKWVGNHTFSNWYDYQWDGKTDGSSSSN